MDFLNQPPEKKLIVGAGAKCQHLYTGKRHLPHNSGEKTLDSNANQQPDFLCNFTHDLSKNSALLNYKGHFREILFENVPFTLFMKGEIKNVAKNVDYLLAPLGTVEIRTGAAPGPDKDGFEPMDYIFSEFREERGYTVSEESTYDNVRKYHGGYFEERDIDPTEMQQAGMNTNDRMDDILNRKSGIHINMIKMA